MREGTTDAWLAERFTEHRGRLRAVAYRMLGSLEEAEDAVQEAWVRFSAAGADEVVNLGGWLTTIVTRVCLNALRARAARPETLAGAYFPDPVISPADGPTPEQEALLADSVGLALLVVLDALTPAERVAFVLHDVFGVPFGEIAPVLERTPEATRQLASRARHRVKEAGTREPDGAVAAQRAVIDAFFAAARAGDLAGLVELLDPDVVLRTDGFVAGPAVIRGAQTVASAALGGANPGAEFQPVLVNGAAGVLITLRGRPAGLMAFTVAGGRITAVDGITDPYRLRRLLAESAGGGALRRAVLEGLGILARAREDTARLRVAPWFETEARAHTLRYWAPVIVPGLVQTMAYARELFDVMGFDDSKVSEFLEVRMGRQGILDRPDAPDITIVLWEPVLYHQIGTRQVMRDQLARLADLAAHPAVTRAQVARSRRPRRSGSTMQQGKPSR